ncbi:aminopeptidase P family protein [Leptospira bandrabouensis]|uniref:M24 family metallopeptidase n=1 Tax=Leptospira bandrabouensis TaxID=2484903 RepID=UPI00223C8C1B|nr:M24 family metallopeptidase [Leptospira bandrabouensis]MCW7459230.1 aminopeptidase P family protein [Leptospira bandrabouensis]MCW7478337.1 aminopeptidase P family protein [Leptospira bandrabouensis]MCW7485541.1 aminopeptidase P family protein [Leptospira bandrabouensis]
MVKFENIKEVQNIAKRTIEHVQLETKEGMSELDIKMLAESFMKANGIHGFWYYNIGAFVLTGNRSLLSISGKEYVPSKVKVKNGDVVTIDLSPVLNNTWGDYARTFCLGNSNNDINEALYFIKKLHYKFIEIYNPNLTISTIHKEIYNTIHSNNFKSLDFRNNFGHTIEEDITQRKWFDSNNNNNFSTFKFFTFEPHIKKVGANYGIKHENIYYFDGTKLIEV